MIPDFGTSDVLNLNLPLKDFLSNSLKRGEWPLWSSDVATGFPILDEGQIGTFYLPNLLLFRFFPTILAYNLNLMIAFFLCGLGTYVFSRSIGLGSYPSTVSGLTFAFSGYFTVHLNHFNLVQSASLLPLVFWSAMRTLRAPSLLSSFLFSFFLSQQIFAGHFYIVFITLIGIFFLFGVSRILWNSSSFGACFPSRASFSRSVLFLLLGILLSFFLSAIQLFPTFTLWQLSSRHTGLSFETTTAYPYPLRHLITFFSPFFFGSPKDASYPLFSHAWGIFWENTGYIGLIPISFALVSIFFLPDTRVALWFLVGTLSFLLVLGKYSPLYFLFSFPPFWYFRVPSKFLLLVVFSLTLLSSLLLARFQRYIASRGGSRLIILFFLPVLIFLDSYSFASSYLPITPASWWTTPPPSAVFLSSQPEGRIASFGTAAAWNSLFLKHGWSDMTPYVSLAGLLAPNSSLLFSLPHVGFYTGGLIPRRVGIQNELTYSSLSHPSVDSSASASLSTLSETFLSLSHTRYLISSQRLSSPSFEQLPFPSSPSPFPADIRIYRNLRALPRTYLSFSTTYAETLQDAFRLLSDPHFLDTHRTIVEDVALRLSSDSGATGSATISFSSPLSLGIHTTSTAPSLLVLADTPYPGWTATVDGLRVPILPVNVNQRGVFLSEGAHDVLFSFRPSAFLAGKIVTIATMIGMTVLTFFLSMRQKMQRIIC